MPPSKYEEVEKRLGQLRKQLMSDEPKEHFYAGMGLLTSYYVQHLKPGESIDVKINGNPVFSETKEWVIRRVGKGLTSFVTKEQDDIWQEGEN